MMMWWFQNQEMVLARYSEATDWLGQVPPSTHVTIYDKLEDRPDTGHKLPNVGREAHTYSHHVLSRYENLSEITIFSQACPFDHSPDFIRLLYEPTWDFRPLGRLMGTGPNGDCGHRNLPNAGLFRSLTGRSFPDSVQFSPGACFAVRDVLLRRYPRVWWGRLVELLEREDTQTWMPWAMERLWGALLSVPE